jgi:DNA mismatch endonuclease, patch repair protein
MGSFVPTYGERVPASKGRSRAKSTLKRSMTKPEVVLLSALRSVGVRCYRTKRNFPGKPDVIFQRKKVAVFCDGDFWHGRNWPQRRARLMTGANADYWVPKIEYNRRRDRQNNLLLRAEGWVVIRLWESIILRDPMSCAEKVRRTLSKTLQPTAGK